MADFMKKEYELAKIHKAFGFHGHSDIITVSVVGISIRLFHFDFEVPCPVRKSKKELWMCCGIFLWVSVNLACYQSLHPLSPAPSDLLHLLIKRKRTAGYALDCYAIPLHDINVYWEPLHRKNSDLDTSHYRAAREIRNKLQSPVPPYSVRPMDLCGYWPITVKGML